MLDGLCASAAQRPSSVPQASRSTEQTPPASGTRVGAERQRRRASIGCAAGRERRLALRRRPSAFGSDEAAAARRHGAPRALSDRTRPARRPRTARRSTQRVGPADARRATSSNSTARLTIAAGPARAALLGRRERDAPPALARRARARDAFDRRACGHDRLDRARTPSIVASRTTSSIWSPLSTRLRRASARRRARARRGPALEQRDAAASRPRVARRRARNSRPRPSKTATVVARAEPQHAARGGAPRRRAARRSPSTASRAGAKKRGDHVRLCNRATAT